MTPDLRRRVSELGLQSALAPRNICYGCGPANARGLGLQSWPGEDEATLVACWKPLPHHQAFEGVLNGGIIGTLLDCHSNWTAIWHFLRQDGGDTPRCCVTADYAVRLRRPTPAGQAVALSARVAEQPAPDRVIVEAELTSGGEPCASCRGTFCSVGPDHPAYHDW